MDSFFVRLRNPLVLLALVIVQTIALAVQVPHVEVSAGAIPTAHDSRQTTLLRYWAVSVVTPVERISHTIGSGVWHLWSNYLYLRHTRQQNVALQAEVDRLRVEQAAFAEDAAQGRRLGALLEFKRKYIASTVAAQVIGTSGSDRSRVVYLDKGSADGLRTDQAVITPSGIVGKLRDVFPHTSQLLLINDPMAGAGVILQGSRLRGILRGTANGRVEIGNLTSDSRIKVGDTVVTSGGDQIFPRGLPVGTIIAITPDREHQPYTDIELRPAADLQRLDEVLIITGTQPEMTAAEASDASTAESTAVADDARHAADLAAERLPGLQAEPDRSGAPLLADPLVGGLPNVPNSGVPRPVQPLHADHYSPGTTPSADDLKPGSRPTGDPELPRSASPDHNAAPARSAPAAPQAWLAAPHAADPRLQEFHG